MLTERLEFVPDQDAEFFAAVPAAPAVFLLRGDDPASDPYVSKTANLRRRLQRLLGIPTEQSKRLNLRDRVRGIEYSPTGSDFESGFLLYKLLRATFPQTYASRLRLRPSPVVKLHLENEYLRVTVLPDLGGHLYSCVDKVSGRVSYAVLGFGGFLGIGNDHYPLPWQSLKYDTRLGGYVTGVTESQLRGAPKFGNDNDWNWGDPARNRVVNDYYGVPMV